MNIFQCMVEIFLKNLKMCNSTKNILIIHWKIWFLYVEISRALRFKSSRSFHDDVIKRKHFPRYWPLWSPTDSPHKGQWRGALMFSLICACTNGWANNGDAGDLRRHRAHYNVIVMFCLRLNKASAHEKWRYVCKVSYQWLCSCSGAPFTSMGYSKTTWAVGVAQLTHHEVQGGGKTPETEGRGIFAPTADRVVS